MSSSTSEHDLHFMQHAMDLARKGTGLASPNPMVGCVMVKDGTIVGEGFHQYEKRDHAEIVALKQAGERARGATLYVTLEPCNHTGRTGPCSEAIVAARIARVVAATEDPNPKTRGGGFARLRAAGIEVACGLMESEAKLLNEAFAYWITTRRPFATLKSALTLDGQLALPSKGKNNKRVWITGEEARAEVQRMRHGSDALLTGIGTILADDPLLTDRSELTRRRKLLRVIVDSKLRLPLQARIVETADDDLVVFTGASLKTAKARALGKAGVEVAGVKLLRGRVDLVEVMKELGRRDNLSVIIEAGPRLNAAALSASVANRMMLFYAPKFAGDTRVPFLGAAIESMPELHLRGYREYGADIGMEFLVKR